MYTIGTYYYVTEPKTIYHYNNMHDVRGSDHIMIGFVYITVYFIIIRYNFFFFDTDIVTFH